ncbi:MAG: 3-methyl-2-oxobutanoate dehydrogenase subunit VorB [Paracholeplasma sp.]|jgi:2-oxoglutarate ferredoxin oxidoreductase subunit alpha|nr:3-methyl-2-oxobutanoate dehydrogenase subunit VorB [Paracholeplasma sp.]MDY3195434.1 3-methyl-2-oxobutanoate dehydrogenase subunit VorB [Paracholeplasma sp.]
MAKQFLKGNEAIALAAIKADIDAFFGYPITPQNEVPEYLSTLLPQHNKVFVQAESEVAAINMVYGAAGCGKRVMTSSSSVGIALKQEGISYLSGAELPCVIVSVMRGGPGLGGIQPSQADYYQAVKGGGNGDYQTIVYAPSNIQETVDLLVNGFDVAEKYRNPVMILIDGLIAQMIEAVDMDKPYKRPPFKNDFETIGTKYHGDRRVVNSLFLNPSLLEEHNLHLQKKYEIAKKEEVLVDYKDIEKADYVIVCYGTVSRIAKSAIKELTELGYLVGLIRPITLWPFPTEIFSKINPNAKGILVTELSLGQMLDDVLIANKNRFKVAFYGRTGGMVMNPEEIRDAIINFDKWVIK